MKYTKSLATDFGGSLNEDNLDSECAGLTGFDGVCRKGDVVDIYADSGQQAAVDSLVSAHDSTPVSAVAIMVGAVTIPANTRFVALKAGVEGKDITLPPAASFTARTQTIEFKVEDAVLGQKPTTRCCILAATGDTIEGQADVKLFKKLSTLVLYSDGVNTWYRKGVS